jgi:hypothetical protein
MRGTKHLATGADAATHPAGESPELAATLREVAAELRALRETLVAERRDG